MLTYNDKKGFCALYDIYNKQKMTNENDFSRLALQVRISPITNKSHLITETYTKDAAQRIDISLMNRFDVKDVVNNKRVNAEYK